MDNGNLAWLDYSVPARRFRTEQYPLHERGCGNTNVEWHLPIFYTGYNKPFALSFHSSSG